MRKIDIVIFGRIPPPIGGVTKSVENLISCLSEQGVTYDIFSFSSVFSRFNYSHVNYSKPWKILIAGLLSKIISKKSVFVIHGNDFDFKSKFNIYILTLFDGIIYLNDDVGNKLRELKLDRSIYSFKIIKLTPLLTCRELREKKFNQPNDIEPVIDIDGDYRYVLIYINDLMIVDSNEVYGGYFYSSLASKLPDDVISVVVDLSGKFRKNFETLEPRKLIYFDSSVNFSKLLSQVDLYVRPTSNDGSSMAILESLMLGTPVLASDAVDRPPGVLLYSHGNETDFINKVNASLSCSESAFPVGVELSDISELTDFLRLL